MFFDTSDLKDSEIYLKLVDTKQAIPEKYYLPAYKFDICLLDHTIIGKCDLRVGYNQSIYYAGNIGYNIDEKYRGNRYSLKACKLLFKLAKKHQMDYVYITCVPDNKASNRICILAKGKLLEAAEVPKNHNMYEMGYRTVNVYKIEI